MNDIVLNGETLEISRVVDSIEIEGFDHTFADGKAESKLVVTPGGSPGPEPIEADLIGEIEILTEDDATVIIEEVQNEITVEEVKMAPNFVVDEDYTTAFNSKSSMTTKTFTDTIKAGDVILLMVAHRATITVPSEFVFMKKHTESGNPQYNSIYTYEVQNDISSYSVTITQSSSQRLNYYIAVLRGCTIINNTSIDRNGSSATSYTFTADTDLSNFVIFYSCVYSGGNPSMPAIGYSKLDLDTANEHRMVIFKCTLANAGNTSTISGMGDGNIISAVKLERSE